MGDSSCVPVIDVDNIRLKTLATLIAEVLLLIENKSIVIIDIPCAIFIVVRVFSAVILFIVNEIDLHI